MDELEDAKIKLRLLEIEHEFEQSEEYLSEQRAKRAMWVSGIVFWLFVSPFTLWYGYYVVTLLLSLLPFLIRYAVSFRVK